MIDCFESIVGENECFDLLFSSVVLCLLSLDLIVVQFMFETVETCNKVVCTKISVCILCYITDWRVYFNNFYGLNWEDGKILRDLSPLGSIRDRICKTKAYFHVCKAAVLCCVTFHLQDADLPTIEAKDYESTSSDPLLGKIVTRHYNWITKVCYIYANILIVNRSTVLV